MTKGIIYYTHNLLDEAIFLSCQKQILKSRLPITSVSLKPIDFGNNIVVDSTPGYISMINQIIVALENSKEDVVFFCEHDVLYHKSHFEFTPKEKDVFYYNSNNWRWDYPYDRLIKYDGLISLSQLCCYRELALNHYEGTWKAMEKIGFKEFLQKDPHMARLWGYEPGRRGKKDGALFDEKSDTWNSEFPNIDIRHHGTFSLPKVKQKDFRTKPNNWQEITVSQIPGWKKEDMPQVQK